MLENENAINETGDKKSENPAKQNAPKVFNEPKVRLFIDVNTRRLPTGGDAKPDDIVEMYDTVITDEEMPDAAFEDFQVYDETDGIEDMEYEEDYEPV